MPAESGWNRFLLVDDDQDIREWLQTYLSRSGFQVRTVADSTQFREAMLSAPADLVVLDVMPDEDGFSLCHQRLAQMPIIMLTASSDETDRANGLELGADDFMTRSAKRRWLPELRASQMEGLLTSARSLAHPMAASVGYLRSLPLGYRPLVVDQLRSMGTRFFVSLNDKPLEMQSLPSTERKETVPAEVDEVLRSRLGEYWWD